MRRKSAVETVELPLEDYPGFNPLALDLVRGESKARTFFDSADGDFRRPSPDLAAALVRYNHGIGNDAATLVSRWRAGAVTIVAGQQAGFAGGPLYTLTKIASLLDLQRSLSEKGIDAIPVFWIATEDHDFDEVARAELRIGRETVLVKSAEHPGDRFCVGPLPIPRDLVEAFLEASGTKRPDWLAEGTTFGESFARLIASTVPGKLILVDSLLPDLRTEAGGFLSRIHEEREAILAKVAETSRELEAAGYRPQVEARSGDEAIPLLYELDERMVRWPFPEEGADVSPERISTAALARPLLQDAVFTPWAFVGGPAEVAYYAQLRGVHEYLGIHRPRVMLRGHALVAPAKELRAAFDYGLEPYEMFFDPDTTIMEREQPLKATLEEELAALRESLSSRFGSLAEAIGNVDSTMKRPFERSRKSIEYHLDQARRRGTRAIARRHAERFAAFERLHDTLMPRGVPQDRIMSWLSYQWYSHTDLLAAFEGRLAPQKPTFSVIPIGGDAS